MLYLPNNAEFGLASHTFILSLSLAPQYLSP